jgi:hypothetical protein
LASLSVLAAIIPALFFVTKINDIHLSKPFQNLNKGGDAWWIS